MTVSIKIAYLISRTKDLFLLKILSYLSGHFFFHIKLRTFIFSLTGSTFWLLFGLYKWPASLLLHVVD